MSSRVRRLLLILFFTLLTPASITSVLAQLTPEHEPAAVKHEGVTLFVYHAMVDGLTPIERVERTRKVLHSLAEDPDFEPGRLRLHETPRSTNIVYGSQTIAIVSDEDARAEHSSTRFLASSFLQKLKSILPQKVEENTAQRIATGIGITIGSLVTLALCIVVIVKGTMFFQELLNREKGRTIKAVRIQRAELLSAEMVTNLGKSVVGIFQFILIAICVYVFLIVVLSAFPSTMGFADMLRESSMNPVQKAFEQLLTYLPNLLAIVVIGVLTYATIAFARFIFDAVEAGTVSFSGFRREWAKPTYKLTRFFIIIFFLVLALPYAPGYESDSFKQVGILFGLLLSLGSTSVVGHVMAGTVLTYTNAFKIGDRIKIGECIGDVIEKTMFVTRIKTPKNEVVSIPNGEILNANIVNFSNMAASGELILYTTVTIGYDVPWQTVNELLRNAALATASVLKEPEPFVLQKELADFSIAYELNAYTDDAKLIPRTYSALHQNILEEFNKAGVEIMSPNYFALRDGNSLTLPESPDRKNQPTPHFRIGIEKTGDS